MDFDIKDFSLEDITVSVGTAVTWTNQDAAQHTSTSGEPDNETSIWGSGLLSKGGSFSFTFTEAGTFKYFCTVHPSIMKATVTVTDGASDAAPMATSEPTATLEPTATPVPPTATPEPTPAPEPAPSADELDSNIQNFTLQDITVSVGTTVPWTNRDSAPHTATSGEPGNQTGLWDSGRLSNGGSFSFTFTESGAFKYFCSIHGSSMTATVTVTDGETEAEPTPTPEPTATAEPAASTLDIFYARHLDLTISAGTSITWTNRDEVAHTVTAGDSPKASGLFDSGNMSQGRTFDFKFSAAGTYTYFCAIHPAMEGTITVTEQ